MPPGAALAMVNATVAHPEYFGGAGGAAVSVVGYATLGGLALVALGLARVEVLPRLLGRTSAHEATPRDLSPVWLAKMLVLVLAYWTCAISLTFVNSWLMSGRFPHAATLMLVQMVFSSAVSAALVYGAKLAPAPEGLTLDVWLTNFLPIGALYAIYLWGSNTCYDYLEVGFVQMLKPSCGLFMYALMLRCGLETWTARKGLNLLVMFGALSMASLGQEEIGSFSLAGVVLLLVAMLANALYIVSLQRVLQQTGTGAVPLKLNALSTLTVVGPAAACWLAVLAAAMEWRAGFEWTIPTWLLVVNCLLALSLNVVMLAVVQRFSALSYSLLGFAKDGVVVVMAGAIDHEAVDTLEISAYAVSMFAQVLWAYRKVLEKAAAEKELKQPEMYRNLLDAAEADQADDELVPARAVLSNAYGAFVPLSSKC